MDNSKLSNNLHRHEFACSCGCGFDTVDVTLVHIVQGAADYFALKRGAEQVAVIVTGGNRCRDWNAECEGANNSQHIYARAVDHRIKTRLNDAWTDVDTDELANYYDSMFPTELGIGRYSNRVHVDTRTGFARWDVRV